MATAPPYDDGSSTESEYYFDPREEAEEEAAYAWTHEHDTQPTNLPTTEDSTVIKQEYSTYGQLQTGGDEIALPQGSEWSHGGASTVYDNAVEQALAMAQELTDAQREEPLTDDTINSTSSPIENKETRSTVLLKKSEEVKVKPKVISLKSVKAPTPPASITKFVAVGLRSSPKNVVGEPNEMLMELSVARPQWRSQCPSQKSPNHVKKTQAKRSDVNVSSVKQVGQNKSPLMGKYESEKVSSSRRMEHSKSPSRRRSRSPSIRRAEKTGRRKRSISPVRHSSRRSRSRSPSRRNSERRKRSRSKSAAASPRSRSYRYVERVESPRHKHDSDRRTSRTYKRSRSPSHPSRTHTRFISRSRSKSRSRSHDRYNRRYESSRDRNERRASGQLNKTKESNRHESTTSSREARQKQETQHRSRYNHTSQTHPYDEEKGILAQRNGHKGEKRSDGRSSGAAVQLNAGRGVTKARLRGSEPLQSRRAISDDVAVSTTKPSNAEHLKKSPREHRIKPRVESSVPLHDGASSKKYGYVYHDVFERRVFKLKVQEADIDEKMAAGPLSGKEIWFYDQRRHNMAAERAKLEAENLNRFEKLYRSTQVSKSDLKKYQSQRDFATRVVRLKREQASLQEQKGLFLSSETQDELLRRLDKVREELIAENPVMFHKVMTDSMPPPASFHGKTTGDVAQFAGPQRFGKRAHGTDNYHGQMQNKRRPSHTIPLNRQRNSSSSVNSRVVVGASLQLEGDHGVDNFKIPPAIAGNTPWFLKG